MILIDDAVNLTNESHNSNTQTNYLPKRKKERKTGPNREHQCDAGQIPSECQVRTILATLEC